MRDAREKAIELLLLGADVIGRDPDNEEFAAMRRRGGVRLALDAYLAVGGHRHYRRGRRWRWMDNVTAYQEAAGLLLDGWAPGDTIARRRTRARRSRR